MNGQRKRVLSFLQLATEELEAARNLVRSSPRQAAYLNQQCAEKIARAVLVDAGVQFGTGHNLAQMASVLPERHPWIEKIRSLDKHSPAATRYRYPTSTGGLLDPPDVQHLQQDVDELQALLEEAWQSLTKSDDEDGA